MNSENPNPGVKAEQTNEVAKDFCEGCDRRCCSMPVVLPHERENIIKATRMGFLQRRRIFNKRRDYYIIKGDICPFLKGGACSIEEVKPLNCRIFPLALTHQGRDAEWDVSPECPSSHKVPYEFVEHAKNLGQPLLEKHRERGPLI
jgi:Fe-S-cluster containining protein